MARDRSTIARKWLEFETTEYNHITQKIAMELSFDNAELVQIGLIK